MEAVAALLHEADGSGDARGDAVDAGEPRVREDGDPHADGVGTGRVLKPFPKADSADCPLIQQIARSVLRGKQPHSAVGVVVGRAVVWGTWD